MPGDAIPGFVSRLSPEQNGTSNAGNAAQIRAQGAPLPSLAQLEAAMTSDGARGARLPEHNLSQAQLLAQAPGRKDPEMKIDMPEVEESDPGAPTMETLRYIHALATGKQPLPEPASAPNSIAALTAPVTPAPAAAAAPQPWELAITAMQQQATVHQAALAQQQAQMMAAIGQLAQTISQPRPLSQAEQEQAMLAEMQAHGLNPRDPVHIGFYQAAKEVEQLRQHGTQRINTVEQSVQQMQRQTQLANLQASVAHAVNAQIDPKKDVPAETIAVINALATSYAAQGARIDQAIESALRGYKPLLDRLPEKKDPKEPAAADVSKLPPELRAFAALPAFKGKTAEEILAWVQTAGAVPVTGRTSKRAQAPSLREMDALFFGS